MARPKLNKIAAERRDYLLANTGIDYILETRDVVRDFTEFVTTQGGDVAVYRVYGTGKNDFKIYMK